MVKNMERTLRFADVYSMAMATADSYQSPTVAPSVSNQVIKKHFRFENEKSMI